MTTISATVIADSISREGIRLTTFHLRYPRFIHAELMTHRVFSRNARSSRAVPVAKIIEEVMNDPVVPIHWGKNQPGMQAREENNAPVKYRIFDPNGGDWGTTHLSREDAWLKARDYVVEIVKGFHDAGYHKQIVNRFLEPFMHIDTLVTATEWSNWYALRDHPDAEPHIQKLAQEMRAAHDASTPRRLRLGEWHLPYIRPEETNAFGPLQTYLRGNSGMSAWSSEMMRDLCIKVSVARCARISYKPFDGNGSVGAEVERYEKLVGSHPMHASPAEHQATPDTRHVDEVNTRGVWARPSEHGNFRGWRQYRKMLPGECQ